MDDVIDVVFGSMRRYNGVGIISLNLHYDIEKSKDVHSYVVWKTAVTDAERLQSVEEIDVYLGVSKETIRGWVKKAPYRF